MMVMTTVPRHLIPKPRLRGSLHAYSFGVSLVCGVVLVLLADGTRATVAAAVFAASASAMLGVSGLFHRRQWGPRGFSLMRRLDHAMIYLLIAGSYTPFALLAMDGPSASRLLWFIWICALIGIALEVVLAHAPSWIRTALCVAMGWVAIFALPEIVRGIGTGGAALLAGGGVLYTVGGVVYALHRPDPRPHIFGYHEIFHVFVVAALLLHYAAVAIFALPA